MADSTVVQQEASSPRKKSSREAFLSKLQDFDFGGDAIDVALRKFLARVHLPKETQHIDHAMEDFARRYSVCNPDLIDNPDAVYAVAFSILMLNTDAHNKNVRQKMNKETFTSRTRAIVGGENIPVELLDIMYDNIVHQPFTYVEGSDEDNRIVEKSTSWFTRLAKNESSPQQAAFLEDLYPKLAQLMPPENTFSYKRLLKPANAVEAYAAFSNAQPLRLAGVRNRHQNNHSVSQSNTFVIRVAKAGVLERKHDLLPGGKKATARSWRPLGVILSGSQIIFFADILAFESHLRSRNTPTQKTSAASLPRDSADASLLRHVADIASPASRPESPRNSPRTPSQPPFSATVFQQQYTSTSTIDTNRSLTTSNISIDSEPSLNSSPLSNHNLASSTSLLRPMQIISLADAVCIYDESYTKYPHVFLLIVGDGQQFYMRADSAQELDDWMNKINYAATIKTTGVRLRMVKAPRFGERVDQHKAADRIGREEKAKLRIRELSQSIVEQEQALNANLQLRRNLIVMTPLQKATKERLLAFAETVGKQIQDQRIELQRLACYREYLERALQTLSTVNTPRKMSAPLLARGQITGPLLTHRSATAPSLQYAMQHCQMTSSVRIDKEGGVWTDFGSTEVQIPKRTSSLMSHGRDQPLPQDTTPQDNSESETEKAHRRSSCPQIPPVPLTQPMFGRDMRENNPLATADEERKPEKDRPEKNKTVVIVAPLDTEKWTRRRSNSNPVKQFPVETEPNAMSSLPQPESGCVVNRARSSSEASSVRDEEDDELTVVHLSGSQEDLASCMQNWTLT